MLISFSKVFLPAPNLTQLCPWWKVLCRLVLNHCCWAVEPLWRLPKPHPSEAEFSVNLIASFHERCFAICIGLPQMSFLSVFITPLQGRRFSSVLQIETGGNWDAERCPNSSIARHPGSARANAPPSKASNPYMPLHGNQFGFPTELSNFLFKSLKICRDI